MTRSVRSLSFIMGLLLLGALLANLRNWITSGDLYAQNLNSNGGQQHLARESEHPLSTLHENASGGRLQATLMNLADTSPLATSIGTVTMLYGEPSPVYEQALETHAQHAELHRYRMMVLRQKLLGRLWSKPAYILSIILNELQKPESDRMEWLFWFDADTVIINPQIPLEIFLPPTVPSFSG